MNDTYSVWGMCDDAEWLRENNGERDMLLLPFQSLSSAREHAGRLARWAPLAEFEVRDALGETVAVIRGIERERLMRAPVTTSRRRTLGARGK